MALAVNEGGVTFSATSDVVNKKFIISVTSLIFEVSNSTSEIPATVKLSVTLKYVFDMDDTQDPSEAYEMVKAWFIEYGDEILLGASVAVLVAAYVVAIYTGSAPVVWPGVVNLLNQLLQHFSMA